MNTINVNPYGDGDCWNAIFEKLCSDLNIPKNPLAAMAASTVTTIFNAAHELGYKLVKYDK